MSEEARGHDDRVAPRGSRPGARDPLLTGLVGLVVFLWAVWVPALWLDEATTVVLVRRSWSELLAVGLQADPALLPYYLLVKPVLAAAGEMWMLRLVSVAAAAAGVAVLTWLAARCLGRTAGLVAGGLAVVLPMWTYYAQQARPQALTVLAVSVAAAAWWRAGAERGRRLWWVVLALALVATALSNALALAFVLAPLGASLALPTGRRRPVLLMTALVSLGVVVLLSPYLLLVMTRAKGVATVREVGLGTVWDVVSHPLADGWQGVVLVLASSVAAVALLRDTARRVAGVLLVVWAFAPTAVLVLLALAGRSVLIPRYAVYSLPAFVVLLAWCLVLAGRALSAMSGRRLDVVVPAVGVALLALALLPTALGYRAPDGHGEDIRPALAALAEEPGDLPLAVPRLTPLLTLQAYAPDVVADRMPQVGDPEPHAAIAPEAAPAATARRQLAAAPAALLLVRLLPDLGTPYPDARLPPGLAGRECEATVLAQESGWAAERLDCPTTR